MVCTDALPPVGGFADVTQFGWFSREQQPKTTRVCCTFDALSSERVPHVSQRVQVVLALLAAGA